MAPIQSNRIILDKSLLIFFKDALRITMKKPVQAFSFFRTLGSIRYSLAALGQPAQPAPASAEAHAAGLLPYP